MRYIDALKLVDECIEKGVLKTHKGNVLICRKQNIPPPNVVWCAEPKESVVRELMASLVGQKVLKQALEKL